MKAISKNAKGLAVLIIILLVSAVLGFMNYLTPYSGSLNIGGKNFEVLLANTPQKQTQGLSDLDSLVGYDGMYFLFEYRGEHAMVMRRMRFPLDMVWIDGDKIVQLREDLPPEADRSEEELTVYTNTSTPATAVLELPAGKASQFGLKVGDRVKYKEDSFW